MAGVIREKMPPLDDGLVRLEPYEARHTTARSVAWLNDPEVVRYSEQRHRVQDALGCAQERQTMAAPPNKLWAILAPPHGHVGMIGATVDKWNRTADLAILLEHQAWDHGIGTRAWTLAIDWLLGRGGMRKVTAGTMAGNEAMLALMRKSGMIEEGRRRGQFLLDGRAVDGVLTAKEGTR